VQTQHINGVDNIIQTSPSSPLSKCTSCHQHVGSKTLHQQNLPLLNRGCNTGWTE